MSKRGENIYKRKDGRWEGRYIKERSADGKARYAYVYGKSYADAKQKLLDRRIAQAQNIDYSPSHTKYGDILCNWIAMSRVHIKESTYSRYVHLANAHILPYLGELPTGKLTTQAVEKHISFLLNKGRVDKKGGLAPKTVSDILTLIKGSIDYANCSGYSVNCYLDRLTVKKTQLDMRVLSVEEQHRLCDILMQDMNLTKFGVLLCMYTGSVIKEQMRQRNESMAQSRETQIRSQLTANLNNLSYKGKHNFSPFGIGGGILGIVLAVSGVGFSGILVGLAVGTGAWIAMNQSVKTSNAGIDSEKQRLQDAARIYACRSAHAARDYSV